MILIIPILVLLFTAGLILVIRFTRPGFPALWLLAAAGSLIAWISMVFLRLRLPSSFTLLGWASAEIYSASPSLLLDYSSWPYAFALISLVFCIVLVSPGHLKLRSEVISLSGSLALGGLALISVFAANPTTLLLGWAAMDLVELFIFARLSDKKINLDHTLQVYATRIAGLILGFWAFILGSREAGYNTSFDNLSPQVGLFLLISIGLRLGVFPLHLPTISETSIRRGQGTLLRMAPAASALVVLSRLPSTTISPGVVVLLSILAVIALLYASSRWLLEKDDLYARPFFLIGLSAFAIVTVLVKSSFQSVSWGVSLIYLGSILFLLDSYSPIMKGLAFLCLLGFSGLPLTPNASGLSAIASSGNVLWISAGGFAFILILFGYLQKVIKKPELAPNQEQIIYLTYPLAMIILVVGYMLTGLFGWPGSRLIGSWIYSIPVAITTIGLWYWNWRTNWIDDFLDRFREKIPYTDQPASPGLIRRIINLEWIFTGFRLFFRVMGQIVIFIDNLLEGAGGFLWAALVFVLFLAILRIGTSR